MILPQISFSDIQTSDLLFYDLDIQDDCLRFCRERDIDCLPSLDDPLRFYRRIEQGFCEEQVTPERMLNEDTFIFEKSMLERCRANYLLFIYKNNGLTGVVHFSD